MGNFKVIWSNSAKAQLKAIYNYYKVEKKTLQGARNVRYDILRAAKNIQFKAQYQKDEIQPEYRRIIVRNFKLLYKEINGNIVILRIFNTFQNPKTQSEG